MLSDSQFGQNQAKQAIRLLATFLVRSFSPVFCLGQACPPIPASLDSLSLGQPGSMAKTWPALLSGQALPNSGCAGLQFHRIFYSMATVNLALRLGFDPSFHRAGCTPDTRDQQAKLARFYPHSWCQALVQCSGWARLALEYWLPWVLLSLGQPGLMAGTLTARVTPAFRPGFGPVLARLCWPVGPRQFSLNFLGQALTLAG